MVTSKIDQNSMIGYQILRNIDRRVSLKMTFLYLKQTINFKLSLTY